MMVSAAHGKVVLGSSGGFGGSSGFLSLSAAAAAPGAPAAAAAPGGCCLLSDLDSPPAGAGVAAFPGAGVLLAVGTGVAAVPSEALPSFSSFWSLSSATLISAMNFQNRGVRDQPVGGCCCCCCCWSAGGCCCCCCCSGSPRRFFFSSAASLAFRSASSLARCRSFSASVTTAMQATKPEGEHDQFSTGKTWELGNHGDEFPEMSGVEGPAT